MRRMPNRRSTGGWTALRRRRLSRRALLGASARAGVGAAGLALIGCADDDPPQEAPPQPSQQQTAQQATQQAAQDVVQQEQAEQQTQQEQQAQQEESRGPGPHRGGIVRAWLAVEQIDSWDPHRSRRRQAQAVQSLMYQRIVRPTSAASGELEADLCALPEQPDANTFVFSLQQSAAFWDAPPTNGRRTSAHDIVWNIIRQREALDADGAPDPSFFRSAAYARTDALEASDDQTLRLTTAEPDAAYLASVHAAPFAWITSPEAPELYGDDWRDDPSDFLRNSGTGPYLPHTGSGFELNLARSETWPDASSAWADGIVLGSGGNDAIVSLYQAGAIDLADFPLSNRVVEALREESPEHSTYERPYDSAVELITPIEVGGDGPLADPRIVRAVALAVDRQALLQRLYGGLGAIEGVWPRFFEGWALSDDELYGRPGFPARRELDAAQAASLAASAGASEPIPLVVVDLFEGFFPGAGEAVRSMIADATALDVTLEVRPFADAVDQLRSGERFCLLGWGAAPEQPDPTDEWRRTLHSDGAERWSGGANPELDALIDQLGSVETADRQAVARDVQELLLSGEAVQWRVPLVRGTQLGVHQPWFAPGEGLFEYAWWMQQLAASSVDDRNEGYPVDRALPELEDAGAAGSE